MLFLNVLLCRFQTENTKRGSSTQEKENVGVTNTQITAKHRNYGVAEEREVNSEDIIPSKVGQRESASQSEI